MATTVGTCDSVIAEIKTSMEQAGFFYDVNNTVSCACKATTSNTSDVLAQLPFTNNGFYVQCNFCPQCDATGVCADRSIIFETFEDETTRGFDGLVFREDCFTYTSGRPSDTVCTQDYFDFDLGYQVCNTTVNDNQCSSCAYERCDANDEFSRKPMRMDCSNQPGGEVFHPCTFAEDGKIVRGSNLSGVFTIWNEDFLCVDGPTMPTISEGNIIPALDMSWVGVLTALLWWAL
ncbi:expressed unknown protein [Seminavis robusta]|uniref:Uncharacterized protein n=1 Tax=Seminavis robusta TaxID=568900 RepID=A0A9N8DJ24_9STRA|nr:expressed unknown protein [Seminavis robusta]|eukprot:Sro112_g055510.1 n/a (233) ;mRNA; r:19593-20291